MTIYQPLSEEQKDSLIEFLESDQVSESCLDYIALHGFLTGLATGPEKLLSLDWMEFLFDGQPEYISEEQQDEIESLINQQSKEIQRTLYLGEQLSLPCALTVSEDGDRNDLSDWCFGFIESLALAEESWFADENQAEAVAELILPAGIISEQFIDPDLEHLANNKREKQKLANQLLENIQNLYLLYRE